MPPLRVEYAKSSRAKCSLKECSKPIEQGEVRVGTGVMMPGMDEYTYKWRHVCCFTKRQLASVASVDAIDGFDDLDNAEQDLISRLVKGELCGDHTLIGRKTAHSKAAPAAKKRPRAEESKADAAEDVDSDSTVDFDFSARKPPAPSEEKRPLPVGAAAAAPSPNRSPCPYGSACSRTNPEHFLEFSHGDVSATLPPPPTAPQAPGLSITKNGASYCAFGKLCFRTDPHHFASLRHDH